MREKYFPLTLGVALLAVCSVFLLSNREVSDVDVQRPQVLSMTVSVPIPESIKFCGENIELKRFDMRERFDREINSFTYFHSMTMLLIKRANRFFPIIEPILKKNGIPDDFKYLAVVESNLDFRTVSPARATGLWQIMSDAGKENGLVINEQVDERYHVVKSTEAACNYLEKAYQKFGDWPSVALSYNAGMGRISSEMGNQQINSVFDLLLVEESSRYVFRIMAIKEIFTNPGRYGFLLKKEDLYKQIPTQDLEVSEDITDLAYFAKKQGITYFQLKEFNAWLRDRKLKVPIGKSYWIAIPDTKELYYDKGNATIKVHDKNWIEQD